MKWLTANNVQNYHVTVREANISSSFRKLAKEVQNTASYTCAKMAGYANQVIRRANDILTARNGQRKELSDEDGKNMPTVDPLK